MCVLKAISLIALEFPWGCKRLRLPEFLDNRHKKVARLLSLRTGRRYPQSLELISVTFIVQPEGLSKSQLPHRESNPWLVTQGLNQLRYCVLKNIRKWIEHNVRIKHTSE
jgi:hypothetical protein